MAVSTHQTPRDPARPRIDEIPEGVRVLEIVLDADDVGAIEQGMAPPSLLAVEPIAAEGTQYDAILVDGHRLASPPLGLINAAYDRLDAGGLFRLAVSREGLPSDPSIQRRSLGYLSAILRRCGFDVEEPTEVCGDAPCVLVALKSSRAPRWRLDLLQEGEIEGFAALFQDAFGAEISAPLWHWKYGAGRGHGIIARRGERIIAHYGCTRRRALYFGRPISALQMCDVMVDPRERGVMTKQGAMFLTTATILELYLGLRPADLPFGFPSGRHARLGERLGLYAEVGKIAELRWPVLPGRPRLTTRLREIRSGDADAPALVARLWSAMSADLQGSIALVRDWDYLTYRYLEHPHHRYRLILVTSRIGGRPLGLMVVRQLDDTLELLDTLGPLKHLPSLIAQARRLAGRWGCNSLFCWITRPHVPRFATADVSIEDPDISIPTNVWVHGPPVESLVDKWWLMSGDTEFH